MSKLLQDPFARTNTEADIIRMYAERAAEKALSGKPVQTFRDLSATNPTAEKFVEADNVLYRSFRGWYSFVSDRSDHGAMEDRLNNVGGYTTHSGVVAAVDGEGRLMVASATDENLAFLEESGFKKTMNIHVPFSKSQTPIGLRMKIDNTPDQFIVSPNVHGNVMIAIGEMPDKTGYGKAVMDFQENQRDPTFVVGLG